VGADLFNRSLWQTVLYFPGDQGATYLPAPEPAYIFSDSLTVYWPGAFPTVSDVHTVNDPLVSYYGASDSDFFIQYTPPLTVYQPGNPCPTQGQSPCSDEYDIYTPEPGTMVLLGSSLVLLSGVVLRRRKTAGRVA
jgi:hypothetical protein